MLYDLMFKLLKSEICETSLIGEEFAGLKEDQLEKLYNLSKAHDLAHIVGYALLQNELIYKNVPIAKKFEKQMMVAIYRYEKIKYELEQLKLTLEESKIPFIPLKGSVIRQYYPESWMRTSCDIDILVHEEDLDVAIYQLERKLNYKTEKGLSFHDVSMFSPSNVHIELHYSLIEDGIANESSKILSNVWDFIFLDEDSEYCYVMSDEVFYFYHIAHMAKHFQAGGCGIRPFIDLWLLENKIPHDEEKRNALLEKGKLLTFANAARKLTTVWFANGETDDITEQLSNYILFGGVYGNEKNRIEVQNSKKKNKLQYLMSRLFLPYDVLKYQFPILQKHKWLLPFCEVARWFKRLFEGKFTKAVNEVKAVKNISKEDSIQISDLIEKLGL